MSAAARPRPDRSWLAGVHHDGGPRHVSDPSPALGSTVTVRIRVPEDAPVVAVRLRTHPDGERAEAPLRHVGGGWWEGPLVARMPRNPYRFVLETADDGEYLHTAVDTSRAEWPERFDFVILAGFEGPAWVPHGLAYQLMPDRFARGSAGHGARHATAAWDDEPDAARGGSEWFGGDLDGVRERLDHLVELGVTVLYMTPVFTAGSYHRYDVEDFEAVDPVLGGNEALLALRTACAERGIRLVLDVTPNHTSDRHPWFLAARDDPGAATADHYVFHRRPDAYECWCGVTTLPKLDYASTALRDRMHHGGDAVLRRWLRPPWSIDGWRLDVFNMTARLGGYQASAEVAREMRAAIKAENPDAYVLGEHFWDATDALQGDQLDGAMNYTGFIRPLRHFVGRRIDAEDLAAQATRLLAAVPWAIAIRQLNMVGSHDLPRIGAVAGGDRALVGLAFAVLLSWPGLPCLYYGDEVGLDGGEDPRNRAPMPWDRARWDLDLLERVRALAALRRGHEALRTGGLRILAARDGLLAYARLGATEDVVVVVDREAATERRVVPVAAAGIAEGTLLGDLLADGPPLRVEGGVVRLPAGPGGLVRILGASATAPWGAPRGRPG